MSKQQAFVRYYFYINDMGLLTVQLTDEPLKDCIQKTAECLGKLREFAKNEGHAAQFTKDFEEGIG